ncbi:hypothetical protein DKL61_05150 [Gammaproteobacteria bacterium ESL0073]|nr:hypothetical protein DKL61_05150 [Gammaproteobacteria bacterium ESL0073]
MLYVDESIQSDLGYICIGFAFCDDDPSNLVKEALEGLGFDPKNDEYKSSYKMSGSDSRHQLRDAIYNIVIQNCRIGIYVTSNEERPKLLKHIEHCSRLIVRNNKLKKPHLVFVDEGIRGREIKDDEIILKNNCDSKEIFGIQLADFVAYHCSLILKSNLTQFSKKMLVKCSPHPLENELVDLDWLTKTTLRRNFFHEIRDVEKIKGDDWFFKVSDYGFFYSSNLDLKIKKTAEDTFKEMYLGCVW